MKKYWIVLFCMGILFLPNSIKAYYCDYDAITRLKSIAGNVNVSYEYKEANGKVTFQVTLSNLHSEIYVVDKTSNKTYYYANQNELVLTYDKAGTIQYNIYAVDTHGCERAVLSSEYAKLPDYNPYYQSAVCKGVENYGLCQRWQKMTLSYENFEKQVINYKNSLIKPEEPKPEPELPKETVGDTIMNFIGNYYYIFLIVIILGCGFGIYKINKKNSFKF